MENSNPLAMFRYGLKSPITREKYERRVKQFFDFINLTGDTMESRCVLFCSKSKKDLRWAESCIINYVIFHRARVEKGELSANTLPNYYKPIRAFCEMNDIELKWKKITRGLPRGKGFASDRIPTLDEIKKLLAYPDRRIRPAVLTMMSSGIRLGAWDYLRWGDIQPIYENEKLLGAKIIVYRNEPEQYFTFITPEAYLALKEYIDFRSSHGENIDKNSWVMRNEFNVEETRGASLPTRLQSSGLKRLMERALKAQGVRNQLEPGKKRHEFQANHGFRKYFKTKAEQYMKSLNVEILINHSVGLGDNYYRITEKELFSEYLKAVDSLSINQTVISNDELKKEMDDKMLNMKVEFADLLRKYVRKEIMTDDEMAQRYTTLNYLRAGEDGNNIIVKHEDREMAI